VSLSGTARDVMPSTRSGIFPSGLSAKYSGDLSPPISKGDRIHTSVSPICFFQDREMRESNPFKENLIATVAYLVED